MNLDLYKTFDQIYAFMERAYVGNQLYRFEHSPALQAAHKAGKKESIIGHKWSCIGFWLLLRDQCSHLAALVDEMMLIEILWGHDIPEFPNGDIDVYLQIHGYKGKYEQETAALEFICEGLPEALAKKLMTIHEQFDGPLTETLSLEYLIAKFIDTIQGNHYYLTFGEHLPEYMPSTLIILEKRFYPLTRAILHQLALRDNPEAIEEFIALSNHHLDLYRAKGFSVVNIS